MNCENLRGSLGTTPPSWSRGRCLGCCRNVLVYCGMISLSFAFIWYTIFSPTAVIRYRSTDVLDPQNRTENLWQQVDALTGELTAQQIKNIRLLSMIQNLSNAVSSLRASGVKAQDQTDCPHQQLVQTIAVLVMACNRPLAVTNHLDQLLRLRPSKARFPIIVSQDCQHEETARTIQRYGDQITLIQHPPVKAPPDQSHGYNRIARHYRWALNQVFVTYGYNVTIITEDDLDIAVDFFEYFSGTLRLLELDPTLWCVSSWNDNGKDEAIEEKADLLYRSDFFSGLGWMIRKSLWEELEPHWPAIYWDDWMRKPETRKNRACIRPEVSRTGMSEHGRTGVSGGQHYDEHIKRVKFNRKEKVFFSEMDLSYLLKRNYDEAFITRVYSAPSITQAELTEGHFFNGSPLSQVVRLTYLNMQTFVITAGAFNLMDDIRSGVPRTAYKGVVTFMYGETRVYFAPAADWSGYDPT